MSQTLQRAIDMLEMIAERPRRIRELATTLGVHHSTALRLVHTLRANKLLLEEPDHSYRLGSAIFALANRALEQIDLRDIAKPYMRQLGEATSETVHLGIFEDGVVVYVDKVEARQTVRMYSRIGATAPLHCTGVAKAVLAYQDPAYVERLLDELELTRHTPTTITTPDELRAELATVRELGYAFDREEHEVGIHCVAAPIRQADGRVFAALSVSIPTSRVAPSELDRFVPQLVATSDEISRALGWQHA